MMKDGMVLMEKVRENKTKAGMRDEKAKSLEERGERKRYYKSTTEQGTAHLENSRM